MAENIEEIKKWTPGNSVLPTLPKLEKIGIVQKGLSSTVEKQGKCTIDSNVENFMKPTTEFLPVQTTSQLKKPSVEVVPDQEIFVNPVKTISTEFQAEQRGENSNTSELPPGLCDQILDLREDFPCGCNVEDETVNQSRQREHANRIFSEPLAEFKMFTINAYKDLLKDANVSVHCEYSLKQNRSQVGDVLGSEPKMSGLSMKHSHTVRLSSLAQQMSSGQKLSNFFGKMGKTLATVSELGSNNAYSSSVTVSELKDAAKNLGITDKLLFFSNSESKNSCPEWLQKLTEQSERSKITLSEVNNAKIPLSRGDPGQSSSFLSQTLQTNQVSSQVTSSLALSKSVGSSIDTDPGLQPFTMSSSLPQEPEPPDLTRYTISDELKQVLQSQVHGRQINLTNFRYHPYQRPEDQTPYQTTLPNLDVFK